MDKKLAAALLAALCLTGAGLSGCSGRRQPGGPGDGGPAATISRAAVVTGGATGVPPSPGSPVGHLPAPRPGSPYDLNGDGRADLVLTDTDATVSGVYAAGYAAVLPGTTQGPDAARGQVVTQNGVGQGPAGQGGDFGGHTVSADLDGDHRADLVTQAGSDTVFVVWGGAGPLTEAARLAGRAPLTGDFNGDGHPDLAVTGSAPRTAVIMYGPFSRAGKPARSTTVRLAVDRPAGRPDYFGDAVPVAVGDVNGDGRDDLVATWSHVFSDEMPTPRATGVYLGAATGLTRGPRLKDARGADVYGGFYGSRIATGDVNHDGYADVVAGLPYDFQGDEQTPAGGARLMVCYGGRGGVSATQPPQTVDAATPGLPGSPAAAGFGSDPSVGDVDGDGYADVAFATGTADGPYQVLVLRGGTHGLTAANAQSVPGYQAPPPTALLDTTGDRRAELAVGSGSRDGTEVRILRGTASGLDLAHPVTVVPADLGLRPVPGDAFGSGFGR